MINIDQLCFKCAMDSLKMKNTNNVDKGLGVLAAQGPFALYLFLKKEKEKDLLKNIVEMFKKIFIGNKNLNNDRDALEKFLTNISSDIDNLLLVKQTLEQMMTYLRYGVKCEK